MYHSSINRADVSRMMTDTTRRYLLTIDRLLHRLTCDDQSRIAWFEADILLLCLSMMTQT